VVNRLAFCSTSFSASLRRRNFGAERRNGPWHATAARQAPKAASAAGKVLADKKSTKAEKKAAASALAQTPSKGKGKK
jgi:hypothetical protein